MATKVSIPQDFVENIIVFIDMMASRGAIKGDELLALGSMRNNLEVGLANAREADKEPVKQAKK